ncbi:MAG: hypothetical protein IPK28_01875 [Devosia sp.]|nr:hypothetical protein [Devosia sp.]
MPRGTIAAALTLALALPAFAADRADYVTLRTAELLNLQCAALKYVEHSFLHDAVIATLDQTRESLDLVTGAMSREAYDAWKLGADEEASASAAEAGCTDAAQSYLLTGRAIANADIFRAMLLGFHFGSLPADDRNHVALPADQAQAAERYDVFLQQVYGESYPGFAEAQRQRAVASLPASALPAPEPEPEPGIGKLPSFGAILSIDDADRILLAQSQAARVLRQVEFEVMAESNGWFVRPRQAGDGATMPSLERADGAAAGILVPVWFGPSAYRTQSGEEFRVALAQLPDGTIRAMTYGEAAGSLTAGATVRLYLPAAAPPDGMSGLSLFEDPGFREAGTVFAGVPSGGPCLGGPCYDFPPDATPALWNLGRDGYAELFIAPGAGAEPNPVEPGTARAGRLPAAALIRIRS